MTRILVVAALVLAACFSKPPFRDPDGGTGASVTPNAPPKLAAGRHHACAIDAATRLWCWGDDGSGQLGPTDRPWSGTPMLAFPGALEDQWTSVSAGNKHTCGIRRGEVYCWGSNEFSQAGGANPPNAVMLGAAAAERVVAGQAGTCAIDTAKHLWCWGVIDPSGTSVAAAAMIAPTQSDDWDDVSLGSTHACARTTAGKVVCWGSNANHQLGDLAADRDVTAATALADAYVQISANERATCGVTVDGQLRCRGSNASGLLADAYNGNFTGTDEPLAIGPALWWSRIALGYDHACGITADGIQCYGHSDLGAMGDGFTGHLPPRPVTLPDALGAPTEIASGQGFSCARDDAGHVACWGSNKYGENGDGTVASTSTPTRVELGLLATDTLLAVTAGNGHSCALIKPMSMPSIVKCWGDNRSRQVDSTPNNFRELPVVSQTQLRTITSGEQHTCGRPTTGGDVVCWGSNANHQLSGSGPNGTMTISHTVTGGENFTDVTAGSTSTCAVTDITQSLYCWGTMLPGFGDGTAPMKVSSLHHWSEVALGSGFGVGRGIDGELAGFGPGCNFGSAAGAVAYDAAVTLSSTLTLPYNLAPAQSQGEHVCVLSTGSPNGIVNCWGNNTGHRLSPAADAPCTGPVQPGALANGARWVAPAYGKIAAASQHTCAIATEGTTDRLFCWGYNPGDLGFAENNGGNPKKAASNVSATFVATGPNHICVIGRAVGETRDQVYCWGQNRTGEVGNGSRFHDTPVAVVFP